MRRPFPCHCHPFSPKYVPQHPILNLCPSLHVPDHVSNPRKTKGNVIGLSNSEVLIIFRKFFILHVKELLAQAPPPPKKK